MGSLEKAEYVLHQDYEVSNDESTIEGMVQYKDLGYLQDRNIDHQNSK